MSINTGLLCSARNDVSGEGGKQEAVAFYQPRCHCDKRGTVEYNLGLGARRAEAAKAQLAAFGVDAARIKTVSYGKNRPIVEQDGSEWAYQQNRVAITVLD